ncbi:MAG: hypothetical protein AMXMBFR7_48920 [Planctomycetota bacterium]
MAKPKKQKQKHKNRFKAHARSRMPFPSLAPPGHQALSPAPAPVKYAPDSSAHELTAEKLARAQELVREQAAHVKPEEIAGIADGAKGKAQGLGASGWDFIVLLGKQAGLLSEMLYDWVTGKYRAPWRTIAAAAAVLAYFINPIDVIPDFIPVAGFLDDGGVVGLTFGLIREDLLEYCKFRGLDPKAYGLE